MGCFALLNFHYDKSHVPPDLRQTRNNNSCLFFDTVSRKLFISEFETLFESVGTVVADFWRENNRKRVYFKNSISAMKKSSKL